MQLSNISCKTPTTPFEVINLFQETMVKPATHETQLISRAQDAITLNDAELEGISEVIFTTINQIFAPNNQAMLFTDVRTNCFIAGGPIPFAVNDDVRLILSEHIQEIRPLLIKKPFDADQLDAASEIIVTIIDKLFGAKQMSGQDLDICNINVAISLYRFLQNLYHIKDPNTRFPKRFINNLLKLKCFFESESFHTYMGFIRNSLPPGSNNVNSVFDRELLNLVTNITFNRLWIRSLYIIEAELQAGHLTEEEHQVYNLEIKKTVLHPCNLLCWLTLADASFKPIDEVAHTILNQHSRYLLELLESNTIDLLFASPKKSISDKVCFLVYMQTFRNICSQITDVKSEYHQSVNAIAKGICCGKYLKGMALSLRFHTENLTQEMPITQEMVINKELRSERAYVNFDEDFKLFFSHILSVQHELLYELYATICISSLASIHNINKGFEQLTLGNRSETRITSILQNTENALINALDFYEKMIALPLPNGTANYPLNKIRLAFFSVLAKQSTVLDQQTRNRYQHVLRHLGLYDDLLDMVFFDEVSDYLHDESQKIILILIGLQLNRAAFKLKKAKNEKLSKYLILLESFLTSTTNKFIKTSGNDLNEFKILCKHILEKSMECYIRKLKSNPKKAVDSKEIFFGLIKSLHYIKSSPVEKTAARNTHASQQFEKLFLMVINLLPQLGKNSMQIDTVFITDVCSAFPLGGNYQYRLCAAIKTEEDLDALAQEIEQGTGKKTNPQIPIHEQKPHIANTQKTATIAAPAIQPVPSTNTQHRKKYHKHRRKFDDVVLHATGPCQLALQSSKPTNGTTRSYLFGEVTILKRADTKGAEKDKGTLEKFTELGKDYKTALVGKPVTAPPANAASHNQVDHIELKINFSPPNNVPPMQQPLPTAQPCNASSSSLHEESSPAVQNYSPSNTSNPAFFKQQQNAKVELELDDEPTLFLKHMKELLATEQYALLLSEINSFLENMFINKFGNENAKQEYIMLRNICLQKMSIPAEEPKQLYYIFLREHVFLLCLSYQDYMFMLADPNTKALFNIKPDIDIYQFLLCNISLQAWFIQNLHVTKILGYSMEPFLLALAAKIKSQQTLISAKSSLIRGDVTTIHLYQYQSIEITFSVVDELDRLFFYSLNSNVASKTADCCHGTVYYSPPAFR